MRIRNKLKPVGISVQLQILIFFFVTVILDIEYPPYNNAILYVICDIVLFNESNYSNSSTRK